MIARDADPADRLELIELANRYGDVVDARDWEGLATIFTPDVEFDITDFAGKVVFGLPALQALMADGNARHPAAHLITNVHVEDLEPRRGAMRSRLLAVQGDGTVYAGAYADEVVLTDRGWRIARRVCSYTRRTG